MEPNRPARLSRARDDVTLTVDFCGERYQPDPLAIFTIGRDADLVLDDNPFLHRRFLQLSRQDGMWWLANVGSRLGATVADAGATVQSWLPPGMRIPIVFARCLVWFTAGPTTYEFELHCDDPQFTTVLVDEPGQGTTTYGGTALTPDQRMLLLALAEPVLRRQTRGAVKVPSSAEAASRLGWSVTKFNRKLDYLCQKLERGGVKGLHGDKDRLATDRKARLLEYTLAARLVSSEDLDLLEGSPQPS